LPNKQEVEMAQPTVGLMSPGDMGHRVGEAIRAKGCRVVTALAGRSVLSKTRAQRVGLEDAGSLADLVAASDILLSIMPPERAEAFARDVAAEIKGKDKPPLFIDCNAIAPTTMKRIAGHIQAAGGRCLDIGIIGSPPGSGRQPTRFYASGPHLDAIRFLDGNGIHFIGMGPEIGRASAIKMCYAGLTKGTMTLRTSVLLAGEMLGIGPELKAVLSETQKPQWEAMNQSVPFLAADAGRWSGEMEQIAETFGSVGVTPLIHKGAAEVFRLLDASPLGIETRETMDKSRTLDQALAIYADTLRGKKAAE
jgi:3-hydroxyisobutyrate dehydrogenase-like beta-hydroxyacid dehydrogenase